MENKQEKRQKNKTGLVVLKILITLAAAGAAFMVAALSDLLLRSEDIHMAVICLVSYLLPASILPVIWVKKRKSYWKKWLLWAIACAAVLAVDFGLVKHDKSLKVDTYRYLNIIEEEADYVPFEEDSLIVKAKSETLQLEGDVPVLDGTVAFFPLYSAFMHATYPETEEFYYGSFDHVKSWGYEELAEKNSDIFLTLEEPTEAQQAKANSFATTFEYTTIGTEAMVFIVDQDNPVDNLTTEQIRGIYSGEITNWKELGGKNQKIKAYQNEEGNAVQKMMERFMGDIPLMEAPAEMGYSNLYAWEKEFSVYRNKANSIGYAFRYCVKDNADIKYLSVDGVAPTPENIQNGSYKVVTPIFAVTYEENTNENVDKLLDWMLSGEGQNILVQTGYAGPVSDYVR